MGDQHQGGRRVEGRGAAIGGVAAEELLEAGVAEMLASAFHSEVKGETRHRSAMPENPALVARPERVGARGAE
jgi:hypothetical protein